MSKQAFVFPGQGSQSVGMLAELADHYPQIQQTFANASQVLDYDLWDLVQRDPDAQLNQTHITQPALLTASVAIYRLLIELGVKSPAYMAGHSLGEYSALVCAGVLSLQDAVKLVEARGRFMQQAVPDGQGAMYAIIGLEDAIIQQICQQVQQDTDLVIAPVNYNSPGQVVIAGSKEAADKAAQLCKDAGAKRALPLSVSVPSHCALMQPAADMLRAMINDMPFSAPSVPVVNNVDVAVSQNADTIKDALVRQLYCPVRWTESVQYLASEGVTHIFEIGPGKVLAGLIKRIDKSIEVDAINTPSGVEELLS
ncbi:ACP S-malonyltransferase [Aliiglaciecola sp. LCG003]|uniref:ACP S-malonyltransferase n=1 Tax=Aliiglaciecola sp. LCG003 TaxID=3053655 RepID=UPI002573713F|nr:ACP S-malonyltransferase [Aliiglaciecola sp. LCG003]WJG07744.1 ACP S-malonyltransferase [Aliiglaciecola sp. LCG003]